MVEARWREDGGEGFYSQWTRLDEQKQFVKKMCDCLLEIHVEDGGVGDVVNQWAQYVGCGIGVESWGWVWGRIGGMGTVSCREGIYGMFCRWCLPLERLAGVCPGTGRNCWKCGDRVGSFGHMWWTCIEAERFWSMVRKLLADVVGGRFPGNQNCICICKV